jgi:uncharacterized membrane protein
MVDHKERQNSNQIKMMSIRMGLGVALGIAIGAAMHNVAIGLVIGVVIGGIGISIDRLLKRKS